MLQPSFLREKRDAVIAALRKRQLSEEELALVDQIVAADDQRKAAQTSLDEALAKRNKLSEEVGKLFKSGQREQAESIRQEVSELKTIIAELEAQLHAAKADLQEKLYQLPNVPHELVPAGGGEQDNEVYRAWEGELPQLGAYAKPHWELAQEYKIFDLELGVKITGAGFPLFRAYGARLQRALINFFLDEARLAGYEEMVPPHLVNEASAFGTGQLPDKEGQMYHVTEDDLYLIPTAEVPLTNVFRDVILEEDQLPLKVTAYTPCFRREAGSYGAHVRGLNRVHQFDKVEIVQIAHPDKSYDALEEMLAHVSSLLDKLDLPYRILRLCGGDLGFTSALTYD
ncbi:MAG: serine--tRNA ligase, partial [Bacteroidetes bacterium]